MPTAGYTAEPSYGSEWWGSGVDNQHCTAVTMPEAGRITRIGVWLRGKDASCSFRGVVWNSTRNTVLGQTALQTASGAALADRRLAEVRGGGRHAVRRGGRHDLRRLHPQPDRRDAVRVRQHGLPLRRRQRLVEPVRDERRVVPLEPPDGRLRRVRGRLGDVRPPLGRVGQGRQPSRSAARAPGPTSGPDVYVRRGGVWVKA